MTSLTRRRFLEDTLLATAAAAAMPAERLLAADKEVSSNDKLSVAVIGARGRGNEHIGEYLRRKDTPITYICDPDETIGRKRAEEVGKKQGRKPKFVKDVRELLDDKSVDIVSIATPNHWHSLGAIWAMQAGKDVYVEKPVSHNVSEGRRAVETARKHNRICQTGTQCRTMKGTLDAIAWVQSGKIGEVKLARGICFRLRPSIGPKGIYPVPKNIDYSLWLGPAQEKPVTRPQFHYDWHWQWDYGNGDLGNQGIHQMDIARWGLGVDAMSSRVLSYGGRLGYEDAGETANVQVVIHDFGQKSIVFEVRGLKSAPFKGATVGVVFYGTDGYVVLTSYTNGVAMDKKGNVVEKFSGDGDHWGNFIDAVRSRKKEDLHADILEGHLSSALCHTGNISYRLGQQVSVAEGRKRLASHRGADNAAETFDRVTSHLKEHKLELDRIRFGFGPALAFDPVSETFPGNNRANLMLTRDYRKPFVVPASGEV